MSYDSGSNYRYPKQNKKETKIKDYEVTPFDKEVTQALSGIKPTPVKEPTPNKESQPDSTGDGFTGGKWGWTSQYYEKDYSKVNGLCTVEVHAKHENKDGEWVAAVRGETKEQAEANARLIAAAPDMLEALKLAYIDLYATRKNKRGAQPALTAMENIFSQLNILP